MGILQGFTTDGQQQQRAPHQGIDRRHRGNSQFGANRVDARQHRAIEQIPHEWTYRGIARLSDDAG
jgi:hypothetical protein